MPQMLGKAAIFISYAHKDGKKLASQLSEDLTARDYKVWFDRHRLQSGANWSREIEQALDDADVVVALLSKGSIESEVCRCEQLRSLRRQKCVIPLLVHRGAERPLYLEARQYLDFSDHSIYTMSLENLIRDIETRTGATVADAYREIRYNTVPDLPANFVKRPKEIETLRQALLSDAENGNVPLLALKGMGGLGKTVLAQALCEDEAVKAAFPDGIIWIKIGAVATETHLINQMREASRALVKSGEGIDTLEGGSNLLRSVLRGKRALLVLDDVWKAQHVDPFRPSNSGFCRVVLTTRKAEVVAATGARTCSIELLSREKSREMIARYSGMDIQRLPPETEDLIHECGRLPLAIAMIGALLRIKSAANLLHKLQSADLAGIKLEDDPRLFNAIEVSVSELGVDKGRYISLCVFAQDSPIPEEALQVLWSLEKYPTQDICDRFVSLSLASRDEERRLTLHDLQVDYIRKQAGDLRALHIGFLDHYRQRCATSWDTGPHDGYFFEHLGYHLLAAGRQQELRQLLVSFNWIHAKLAATNVASLFTDYDGLLASLEGPQTTSMPPVGVPIGIPPWRHVSTGDVTSQFTGDPVHSVHNAIRLSAHILDKDKGQLASQLLARLGGEDSSEIRKLLEHARSSIHGPWLRTLTVALTPAGSPLVRTLDGHKGKVTAIAVTPDGKLLVSGSDDGMLKAWDLAKGAEVRSLQGHKSEVDAIVVTPDGSLLISFSDDGILKIWDLRSWQEVRKLQGKKSKFYAGATGPNGTVWVTSALAVTPDGKLLIAATRQGTPLFWEIGNWRKLRILKPAMNCITPVVVMPDRPQVAFKSDREIKMFDMGVGTDIVAFGSCPVPFSPMALAVTPDGQLLISGSDDGILKIFESRSGNEMFSIKGHEGWITTVAVTSDGSRVISAGHDKVVKIWNVKTGSEEFALTGHSAEINALAVAPDASFAFSGSSDRTVKIWDLKRGPQSGISRPHRQQVNAVVVTPDGKLAISASFDGTLKLWDVGTGSELGLLGSHTGGWSNEVSGVAVTPDGKLAVSASFDRTLKVWDIASRQEVHWLRRPSAWITGVVVTRDGRRAISADHSGTLKLWDLTTGNELWSLKEQCDEWVYQLAVTTNGEALIAPSGDRSLKVRDIADGRELRSMRGHSSPVHAVAVTPDGRWVISASHDKTLKVWELEKGRQVRTLKGHTKCVLAVAIAPDGKHLVSGSHDCTLRLWEVSSGNLLASFTADAAIHACTFAPDGRTILAGDGLGRVHFLSLEGVENRNGYAGSRGSQH